MNERRIQVDDLMQTGYCYVLTESIGDNFQHIEAFARTLNSSE